MMQWLKKFCLPSELKASGVLGMNARNYKIIAKNNNRRLYPLVDDKVQTKKLAAKAGINTPKLIGTLCITAFNVLPVLISNPTPTAP